MAQFVANRCHTRFTPTTPFGRRLGPPPGKNRLIVYGLCEPCVGHPGNPGRIERRLLANAVAARADPGAN